MSSCCPSPISNSISHSKLKMARTTNDNYSIEKTVFRQCLILILNKDNLFFFILEVFLESQQKTKGKHMVTITVDNTTGSHIQGSTYLKELRNQSKAHQLSSSTKLWKSHDDIYTTTQDIPNGLSLLRYLPSSPVESSYQQFIKPKPIIRSFLIDETGSQLEISEMSKSKHTSPAQGLAYKRREDVAYTNPSFVDSKSSISNEPETKDIVTIGQDISFKTNGHPKTIGFEDDSKHESNGSIKGSSNLETHGKSTPTAQVMPNVHFKDEISDELSDSVKIDMVEDVGNHSNGSTEFPRSSPDADVQSKIIHDKTNNNIVPGDKNIAE